MYDPKKKIAIARRLNSKQSVLGSELFALQQVLLYIREENQLNNYVIFCDSMSALQMIQSSNRNYKQRINIMQRLVLELNKNRDVKLH